MHLIHSGKYTSILNQFKLKTKIIILFLWALGLIEINAQNYFADPEAISRIRSNLIVFSSDSFEGREAATRGEDSAAKFISEKLIEYGVEPFGDDSTFYQNFEINVKNVDSSSFIELFNPDASTLRLTIGNDFYMSTAIVPSAKYCGVESEIVFAGFGISAGNYNYDDYQDLDVVDRVVLIYSGLPANDSGSFLSSEDYRKFSDLKYKILNAAENGASGILILPSGFSVKNQNWIMKEALLPSFTLFDESGFGNKSIPSALLSVEAASLLLEKERYSYDELIAALEDDEIPGWFFLGKKVKFNYEIHQEKRSSKNIIGLIEGTDYSLKNEYVTLGAHYDHEGIVNGEIFNGADDNASGTVAVLEAARRLAESKINKRSILIIFHAAEEKGLLGSKYLTANSSFMNDIIVNINVDMVGREHIDTIYSIGSDKLTAELKTIVEEVNNETVNFSFNYMFDEPGDPQRLYYRSDHYNYAKQNIPVVFFYDYMLTDYHKPSDDADKINFKKIEKVSALITGIAQKVSNLEYNLRDDIKEEIKETR